MVYLILYTTIIVWGNNSHHCQKFREKKYETTCEVGPGVTRLFLVGWYRPPAQNVLTEILGIKSWGIFLWSIFVSSCDLLGVCGGGLCRMVHPDANGSRYKATEERVAMARKSMAGSDYARVESSKN